MLSFLSCYIKKLQFLAAQVKIRSIVFTIRSLQCFIFFAYQIMFLRYVTHQSATVSIDNHSRSLPLILLMQCSGPPKTSSRHRNFNGHLSSPGLQTTYFQTNVQWSFFLLVLMLNPTSQYCKTMTNTLYVYTYGRGNQIKRYATPEARGNSHNG